MDEWREGIRYGSIYSNVHPVVFWCPKLVEKERVDVVCWHSGNARECAYYFRPRELLLVEMFPKWLASRTRGMTSRMFSHQAFAWRSRGCRPSLHGALPASIRPGRQRVAGKLRGDHEFVTGRLESARTQSSNA